MSAPRYRFGPLERRGIAAGLRTGQVLALAGGSLTAVALFRERPSGSGFVLALAVVAASAAFAWLPLRGRCCDEWLPVVVGWKLRRPRHTARWHVWRRGVGIRTVAADLPALDRCRLLAVQAGEGRELGVLHDRRLGAYTGVLAARVRAFGLLAPADQQRRLERWGRELAGLARAGSGVRRVQLIERAVPHHGDELERWFEESRAGDGPAERSYRALLASAAEVTQDHEVLLAVQVAGRGTGPPALIREIRSLAGRLEDAEIGVRGLLSATEYERVLRQGIDPFSEGTAAQAVAPGWDRCRADAAVHRTFWIAQWPRLEVGSVFLAPLLLSVDVVRSISIIAEPVPPARSRAAVEAAITSDDADEQLRGERGFRTTARRRRQQAATKRREAELADGHEEVRFAGFVTVTGRDDQELEDGCDQIRQAAQQAYLELQPMWGEQEAGLAFGALPACRGLRPASRLWGT